jgi:hypothetical protein
MKSEIQEILIADVGPRDTMPNYLSGADPDMEFRAIEIQLKTLRLWACWDAFLFTESGLALREFILALRPFPEQTKRKVIQLVKTAWLQRKTREFDGLDSATLLSLCIEFGISEPAEIEKELKTVFEDGFRSDSARKQRFKPYQSGMFARRMVGWALHITDPSQQQVLWHQVERFLVGLPEPDLASLAEFLGKYHLRIIPADFPQQPNVMRMLPPHVVQNVEAILDASFGDVSEVLADGDVSPVMPNNSGSMHNLGRYFAVAKVLNYWRLLKQNPSELALVAFVDSLVPLQAHFQMQVALLLWETSNKEELGCESSRVAIAKVLLASSQTASTDKIRQFAGLLWGAYNIEQSSSARASRQSDIARLLFQIGLRGTRHSDRFWSEVISFFVQRGDRFLQEASRTIYRTVATLP